MDIRYRPTAENVNGSPATVWLTFQQCWTTGSLAKNQITRKRENRNLIWWDNHDLDVVKTETSEDHLKLKALKFAASKPYEKLIRASFFVILKQPQTNRISGCFLLYLSILILKFDFHIWISHLNQNSRN